MRKYIPLESLTSEGLKEDTSSTAKLWEEIVNMRVGDEGWQPRPGTDRIDGEGLPPTAVVGIPKLICQYKHQDSRPTSETILPASTGNYNQWAVMEAGSNAEALATDPVEPTIFVEETTLGEKTSVIFPTPATTFNAITSLRLQLTVARHATIKHVLIVKVRIAGTDYSFGTAGTITISPGAGNATFEIDSSTNPASGVPWTNSDLAALEIVLEKGNGLVPTSELHDITVPFAVPANKLIPASAFSDWKTGDPQVTGTFQFTQGSFEYLFSIRVTNTDPDPPITAPATIMFLDTFHGNGGSGPIWTMTGKTRAFTLRFAREVGTVSSNMTFAKVLRAGDRVDETGNLRVHQLKATIEGDGQSALKHSLLLITSSAFLRLAENLSGYTDVQGTTPASTASVGASWDSTTFQNKLWVTNGVTLFSYPNSGNLFERPLTGIPIGACLATYNSRLIFGDVTENGVRSPNRVRWCKIDDPANWTDVTSGNMELNETGGKVVALRPIVEQSQALTGVLAAYKTEGIYHLTPTDSGANPFTKKLMDSSAGCIARGTLAGVSDRTGREQHIFLGQVGGTVNVLAWNGAQTLQLGWDIVPLLDRLADIVNLEKAIAVVDTFGHYVLFFPTEDSTFLKTALAYNFNKKIWYQWDMGNVSAVGRWTPNNGKAFTVIARPDSFAYRFTDAVTTDDFEGENAVPIEASMVLGDLAFSTPEIWRRCVLWGVWVFYREGATNTTMVGDVSTDGGITFRANEIDLSTTNILAGGSSALALSKFNFRREGLKHRIRFQFPLTEGRPQLLQFVLETEPAGIEA